MKIATETVIGDSKVHSVFSYECDRCQGDKVHPIMDAHATHIVAPATGNVLRSLASTWQPE
jgi:hypothetical protein